jgi:hypothetical protein
MFKGVTHVHSTYSPDGEFTLEELREVFVSAGCAFACMSDHAEAFDEDKLRAYQTECDALSDARFRFIAGLEYSCEQRTHVLGYGVASLITTWNPQEVIRHVENQGGVSVIAHPRGNAFDRIGTFEVLPHGIETWNTKYDGRYAPRPATFHLLNRLQERKREMRAFYGQDLHWKKQFRGLFSVVECQTLAREEILAALGRGDYFGTKGDLRLPSSGRLPSSTLAKFGSVHRRSDRMRRLLKSANKTSERFGLAVPTPIKSRLRRIY